MNSTNLNDLVKCLKELENAQVKHEINHKEGVYRESVIDIPPYTFNIAYIDFGRNQTLLRLLAKTPDGKDVHFNSIQSLQEFLGKDIVIENSWTDPLIITKPEKI